MLQQFLKIKAKNKKPSAQCQTALWSTALACQPSPAQPGKRPAAWRRGARAGRVRSAVTTRSSSALTGSTVAAGRRQGIAKEHQWNPRVAPGNVVVGGAHLEIGSTSRGKKSGGSSMFRGGGRIR
jgi:hypothetical protein